MEDMQQKHGIAIAGANPTWAVIWKAAFTHRTKDSRYLIAHAIGDPRQRPVMRLRDPRDVSVVANLGQSEEVEPRLAVGLKPRLANKLDKFAAV